MSSNQTSLRQALMISAIATAAIPMTFAAFEQPMLFALPCVALLVLLVPKMKVPERVGPQPIDVSLFFQKGRTFSADGKMFYEVYSKFGDTEKGFVEFTLCINGERKYGRQFCLTKSPSYQQAVCDFVAQRKLVEVREAAALQPAKQVA